MRGTASTTATVVRVNLLPPEIAEKARLRRSQVGMVLTGLAAVAVVGVLYVQQSAQVASAEQAKADAVKAQVALRDDLRGLQHVRDVYAKVDAANATVAAEMKYEVRWSTYLHDLTMRIPEKVWLTKMSASVSAAGAEGATPAAATGAVLPSGLGTVQYEGKAMAWLDVASWLESLAKQKGYADPYFTDSNKVKVGGKKVIEFKSRVTLSESALSNRYKKGMPR